MIPEILLLEKLVLEQLTILPVTVAELPVLTTVSVMGSTSILNDDEAPVLYLHGVTVAHKLMRTACQMPCL